MKNKLSNLLLIPSAVAMMLLMSDGELKYCLAAIVLGLVIGTVLSLIRENQRNVTNKTERLVSLLLAILFCLVLSNVFYKTWINHPYKMKELVELVVPNYELGLRILSIIVAITAVFSAEHCLSLFVPVIIRSISEVILKSFSFSAFIKKCLCTVLCLLLSALLGYAMLIGVYLLPIEPINENVRKSAYTLREEGAYPELSKWATSGLDNYTDSIMLLGAASERNNSALVDSLDVSHGIIEGKNYCDILVSHYLDEKPFDRVSQYARYWHGYMIWLKPVLTIFEYSTIRLLNGMIQVITVSVLCFLLARKGLKKSVIPIILCYLMLMPFALANSLQFSSCFYIFMLSSIVLLSIDREKLQKCAFIVFLFIGILTAFFDFLTYPVATFGVPAIIYLMIIESDNIERKIADIVTGCISWGIGYLGMWMQKWILASIVTENNIIKNALQAILERTGSSSQTGEVYYGILSCIKLNYMAFFKTPVTILTFGYTLFLVIRYLKRRKAMNKEPESIVLPFIIVGGLPAVWYAITLNHSTIHHWFTNKACIVSLLAFLFMLESLTETSNLQTE